MRDWENWEPVVNVDYERLIDKYLITGAEVDDMNPNYANLACVIAEYGNVEIADTRIIITFPQGKVMSCYRFSQCEHPIGYALHMKMGQKFRVRCFPSLLRYGFAHSQNWLK